MLKTIGFAKLHDYQAKPVQLAIREQDQFVVLPTGAGKSACYIIPTLCCGFRTLIFSPLKALIKDQLDGLLQKGLRARAVSSDFAKQINDAALRDWSTGQADFLLVAPERTGNEDFLRAMRLQTPDFVVVDEIHVASEHAFNFRPAYKVIAPFVNELNPRVFMGLTATMPGNVEQDIRKIFSVPDITKTVVYYTRENLEIESLEWRSDFDLLRQLNGIEGSVIVYFSTIKRLEACYETIGEQINGGACIFHGSVAAGSKVANQNAFMSGDIRVVFATNSFGMGVDKSDIRGVFFATIPGSLEELSQGFGRGGRDGEPCRCLLYWDEDSLGIQDFFIQIGYPSRRDVMAFVQALQRHTNSQGLCDLRMSDLTRQAGIHPAVGGALSSILTSEGIIARVVNEKPLRVRPLAEAKTPATRQTLEKVVELGVRNEDDGFYEVDLDFLAEQLDRNPGQVLRNLRTLDNQCCITLEDSGTQKPLRLCREPCNEDFEKIRIRNENAIRKLREVGEFYRVPDSKKHDFLDEYFKNE